MLQNRGERGEVQAELASEKALRVQSKDKCDRLSQECSRLQRAMREQSCLLKREQEELTALTKRCNDLEVSLSDAKQEAHQAEVGKQKELVAANGIIQGAEERTQLMEAHMQGLEQQLEALTTDSVKMKSALGATLRHCEKHGGLHAQRVQELEGEVERARQKCEKTRIDSVKIIEKERDELNSGLKEMEVRLANATRENRALRRMNDEQASQLKEMQTMPARKAMSSSNGSSESED